MTPNKPTATPIPLPTEEQSAAWKDEREYRRSLIETLNPSGADGYLLDELKDDDGDGHPDDGEGDGDLPG